MSPLPVSSLKSSFNASATRLLTELDHVRIGKLLMADAVEHEVLQNLLDNANLVASDAMAPDIVTMRSKVRVADPQSGAERDITLVYPGETDTVPGCISVTSPAGTALLGLRAGGVARWSATDGRDMSLRVLRVDFQPEASGELLR